MKEAMNSSNKMENIKHEDFTREQIYMNSKSVDSSRTQLRIRLQMLDTFKDNYRSKYRTLDRGEEDRDPGSSAVTVDSSGTLSPTAWSARPGQRPGSGSTSPVSGTW